ncbi:Camk kinase [Fusarium falciforme]|uniref:Camk kinase n=1 Tax=Fusarium falciforme TaxID=195108 RepID=UPI00230074B2|nr:Camk kinase [Fusarium falciforme]WAO92365.1 Camk kinase [Fusarium falciforme]
MEEHLSDIVRDLRLSTHSNGIFTIHLHNDPDAPPSAPQRQEHWKKVRNIGHGGQGEVVLETCVKGSRHFTERAVKKIWLQNSDSKRRYERELAAIVKFSHDRILSGIALMHAEGFAHRDIKPRNILIHRHPRGVPPSDWWIKLGDFGISKRVGTDTNTTDLAIGTWQYMAPELLTTDQMSCPTRDYQKPDIWALGVTVFFILTNTVPFSSSSSTIQFATNLGEPFPCAPLRDRNAWLPNCPVSGTHSRTSTISYRQSSLDDMEELTTEISTLASRPTTQVHMAGLTSNLDFLPPTPRGKSVPRPAEYPIQILHDDNNATINIAPVHGLATNLEECWGLLVTPNKAPSSTFADLICSIFNNFDSINAGML